MKILVAIPVYDGKLQVQTVSCLLDEQALASANGDEFRIKFLPSCSHPAMGRNQFATDFLQSDADKLFFLDADITFKPGSMIRTYLKKKDVVGGAYRYKLEDETYPVMWKAENAELWADDEGLLEVDSLPGGFMCISRNALETFKAFHKGRDYHHFGSDAYAFFQMPFMNGYLTGEDSCFCMEYRQAGGKIHLFPELELTHWDSNTPYKGHVGNWLKSRIGAH